MSTITVDLEIENAYPDTEVTTHVVGAHVPAPSTHTTAALTDWATDVLFPYTGTGREDGATYTVRITRSTDPRVIGQTYQFG